MLCAVYDSFVPSNKFSGFFDQRLNIIKAWPNPVQQVWSIIFHLAIIVRAMLTSFTPL